MARAVQQIAHDIAREWGAKVNYAAKPYLSAMTRGDFGHDGQKSVVLYFLGNARSFTGEKARTLKAELKAAA